MNSALLALVCVCLAVPMATGLNCYACVGVSVAGIAESCVDASSSNTKDTCPPAPNGQEAKCSFQSGEASFIGITTKYATRSCVNVATGTANTCTDSSSYNSISGYTGKQCYCITDNCNGQTTLAPAIVTSLVGLVMSLYAVL